MPRPLTEVKGSDTAAPSSVKAISNDKFPNRWKNFEASFRGLSEISQYINAMEVNMDNANRLESELRKKTAEISTQQIGRQHMIQGFTEESKKWQEKESRLVGDLQEAKKNVRSLEEQLTELKRGSISNESFYRKIKVVEDEAERKLIEATNEKAVEINKLKKTVEGSEKKLKKKEDELSKQSTLLIGSEVQLGRCRTDLEEKRAETGLEELSADFASTLMNLSKKFHDFAREHFFTTLPKEANADDIFVELKRSQFMRVVSRPIPVSDTEASKHLRMAAAESIIAKYLTEKILQPLYIVDPSIRNGLENVLDGLLQKSPRQGSILRSLLLAAYITEGNIRETEILNAVVYETSTTLNPLLFDQVNSEAFTAGLNTLLREALDLWSQAQKSPAWILASMEGKSWDWDHYEEHYEAVSLTAAQAALVPSSEEPIMALFPRVYSPTSSVPFHPGFALWSDQDVFVAGELEAREQVARLNSRDGKINGTAGKRRISAGSPKTNLSFHQRMNSQSESTRDRERK